MNKESFKMPVDKQLPREQILELVESKTEITFVAYQDYADIGTVTRCDLNSNFKESYGVVYIQPKNGKLLITDVANVEFFLEEK